MSKTINVLILVALTLFMLFAPGLVAAGDVDAEAVGPNGAPNTCGGKRVTIYAWPGRTTHGTNGPDVIGGTNGPDRIYGWGGNDTICGWLGNDIIDAGDGNDVVSASGGNDRIYGGRGNDLLMGNYQDDWIDGGKGTDICGVFAGHDTARNCENLVSDPPCDPDDDVANRDDDDCDDD